MGTSFNLATINCNEIVKLIWILFSPYFDESCHRFCSLIHKRCRLSVRLGFSMLVNLKSFSIKQRVKFSVIIILLKRTDDDTKPRAFAISKCFLKRFISFLLIHMYIAVTRCLKAIDCNRSSINCSERNQHLYS